jgi:hypothetical protein
MLGHTHVAPTKREKELCHQSKRKTMKYFHNTFIWKLDFHFILVLKLGTLGPKISFQFCKVIGDHPQT